MELGNKLIKLRKRDKISQEELAEKLGVTRQTISNWESNATKPDINQLKKISNIFNISIDDMVDNNVRDIIEKKVSKTEELTNRTTKNIRIIIITLYFVILIGIVGFTVYLLTNKDFTDDYQIEISCSLEDIEYFITLSSGYDEDDIITDYVLEITEYYKDDDMDTERSYTERWDAGVSFAQAIDSLRYAKEILITRGAVCK